MSDFVSGLLRLVGFRRVPPETEIDVAMEDNKPAIRVPSYGSVAVADDARTIAQLREEIAERSKKTVEHILGGTIAAGEIRKVRKRTLIELKKLNGEFEEAVAINTLNQELRPDRHNVIRQQVKKQSQDATAEATRADANRQIAELETAKMVADATKAYAIPPPPDAKVVAEERSRAEKEEEAKEWATNVVLDVASWVYPVTDVEGYYAYAACQYFGPRLDHNKSHEEAVELALDQLFRRKQVRGAFASEEAKEMARRAKGMWIKWKTRTTTEMAEAQKRELAGTMLDAARIHREAAELLHEDLNGRDGDEDFDATK